MEDALMSKETRVDTTFGSIEGAAEYLGLLLESVNEAREDLEAETAVASAAGAERRQQAIQIATYKLSQLKQHLATSHRLLNDLRTIRRLLFGERQAATSESATGTSPGQFVTTAESLTAEERPISAEARRNVLKPVLVPAPGFGGDDAPKAEDAVTVHQDAAVYAARLDAKKKVRHQFRPGFGGYLFVVHGSLVRPELDEGGAAKILNEPAIDLEAGPLGAEVLLVETRTGRG